MNEKEKDYYKLLIHHLGGLPKKRTMGAKFMRGFPRYLEEKKAFVNLYDWSNIRSAIDIGTGIGLLPWLLMQKGIKVQATEITEEIENLNGTYRKCCNAIGINLIPLYIHNNTPMRFPGHFDILVANRTVFDRECLKPGEKFNWDFFVNDAFKYVNHIFIKTNSGSKTGPGFGTWLENYTFKTNGNWHIKLSKHEYQEHFPN